ncbi:MAG: VWA domain-containing protein [Candidatus Helarchaeota archaeon]
MIAEYLYKKFQKIFTPIINEITEISLGFIKRFTYYLLDDLYLGKEPKERKSNDPAYLFYKPLTMNKRWIHFQEKCYNNEQYSIYIISRVLKIINKIFEVNKLSAIQENLNKLWDDIINESKDEKILETKQNFTKQLLNTFKLNELIEICKNQNISRYSNLKKSELISLINKTLNQDLINEVLANNGFTSEEINPIKQFPFDISKFFNQTYIFTEEITLDELIENFPIIFINQQKLAEECLENFKKAKENAIYIYNFLYHKNAERDELRDSIIEIIKNIDVKAIKNDKLKPLVELNSFLNKFRDTLIYLIYPLYLFFKNQIRNNKNLILESSEVAKLEQLQEDFNKLFRLSFVEEESMDDKAKKLAFIKALLIKILGNIPKLLRTLIISNYINDNFFSNIEEGIKTIDVLNSIFNGMGWDLSSGILKNVTIDKILEYSLLLEKIPELQKIAENLGRFEGAFSTRERWKLKPYVPEEIFNIYLSDDIHRVLAIELGKLNNPLLKSLFMANWLDHKLLTYQLRGKEKYSSKEKEEVKRGPIIICIDTSGSMAGTPEQLAKALSLAVIKIAQSENRDVHVILFSGPENIKEYSLEQSVFKENKNENIDDYEKFLEDQELRYEAKRKYYSNVIDILAFSFGGGTDFREPLNQAKKKLKDKRYEKADILFISDGISFIDNTIKELTNEIKERNARIFSIIIGNETGVVKEFSDFLYVLTPNIIYKKSVLDNKIGDLLKKIYLLK